LISDIVVNQMEAQCYHSAVVLAGCDKSPFGMLNGLANLDYVRQNRGDHPVHATFVPSHVLKGGTIPASLRKEIQGIAKDARAKGHSNIADDLEQTLEYILQCSSNQAFQGILARAAQVRLISKADHKRIEKELAINTCDSKGGICAFNGTGNSSRLAVSALGLVHPAVELLMEPPTQEEARVVTKALFSVLTQPESSVGNLVSKNVENAVRVHCSTGGSTNLVKHMVSCMIYAGYNFDLWDYQRIRNSHPVPDLFDYSLTEGRDIFALAEQCCSGKIRGVETLLKSLADNGVPIALNAPTMTGTTWKARMANTKGLDASGVKKNPIILSTPKRSVSGIDVLRGNFFESAVIKMSGFSDEQMTEFDEKVFYVLYYESEDEANKGLIDARLVDSLKQQKSLSKEALLAMASSNRTPTAPSLEEIRGLNRSNLFDMMIEHNLFKVAVVISGQGPEAFGMPEMFTPMHHINSNQSLRKMAILLSDGRFSGVTWGAAIGHIAPEAIKGGNLLYLKTGDMLRLQLNLKRVELLNPQKIRNGHLEAYTGTLDRDRYVLGAQRMQRMEKRKESISPTNRLENMTDASQGVVPERIARQATRRHSSHGTSYRIRNTRRQPETEQQVA
jgi:dihydroxyacid dehydratase/phosphogluconate dehydratase